MNAVYWHSTYSRDTVDLDILVVQVYAVVLDAGSTGSRVLGFTFYHSPATRNLVLEDELWHEIKPGLSRSVFVSDIEVWVIISPPTAASRPSPRPRRTR